MQNKATFSCEVIHTPNAQENAWQTGVWLRVMAGLPKHLVQESHVGTLCIHPFYIFLNWHVVYRKADMVVSSSRP